MLAPFIDADFQLLLFVTSFGKVPVMGDDTPPLINEDGLGKVVEHRYRDGPKRLPPRCVACLGKSDPI